MRTPSDFGSAKRTTPEPLRLSETRRAQPSRRRDVDVDFPTGLRRRSLVLRCLTRSRTYFVTGSISEIAGTTSTAGSRRSSDARPDTRCRRWARAHTRPDAEVQAQAEHFAALDQLRGWFDEWAEVVRGAMKSRLAERRTPANSEVSERAGRTRWMQENARG